MMSDCKPHPQEQIPQAYAEQQIPVYEIRVQSSSGDKTPQILRALDTMDQHQENEEQQTEQIPQSDTIANTSMDSEYAPDQDANQDSFEGNGADDEGEEGSSTGVSRRLGLKRDCKDLAVADRTIDTHELSAEAGFEIKPEGKSNKYPLLKVYYEFGPWVGRNRKAICVRCKHTSASSQPERLIRHLRKCVALTDHDRQLAEDLLQVSNANKRKKAARQTDEEDTDLNPEDDDRKADISRIVPLPASIKRLRRDHPDRKKHVDQSLTRFIICNRVPLKSIHSKEFIEFVRLLDPDYRLPSRENITNSLIPSLLNI